MKVNQILSLYEARRNPENNPKVSVYERLKERYAKEGDNLYVSFTKLDKLGIKPSKLIDDETPIGIYAYPAKYVLDEARRCRGDMEVLPHAGGYNYANIFNASGNIIHLDKMTPEEIRSYIPKIKDFYMKNKKGSTDYKQEYMDNIEMDLMDAAGGGNFWDITMDIVESMSSEKYEIIWNKMFRAIGIDGFVDNLGIIHGSEPIQAVFFSIRVIKNNERLHNKWSEHSKKKGPRMGKVIKNMDSSKRIQMMVKHNNNLKQIVKYLKPTEGELIALINLLGNKLDIDMFEYLDNPSEEVQLAAIRKNPYMIDYMDNPSEEVQLAAVKQSPRMINYIKKPHPNVVKYVRSREVGV